MTTSAAKANRNAEIVDRLEAEIERLRQVIRDSLCPGGGYNGQPKGEQPTVGNCLKAGVCGCTTGRALSVHEQSMEK